MSRLLAFSLWAGICLAQPRAAQKAEASAPAAVDQALRARVNQFYQLQVDGKFRQAEALIAEDTKDYYYSGSKPKYLSFQIMGVAYSEDFTRAKVSVMGEQYVMAPGFTAQPFKFTFPSTWKLEDGQWCWYVDSDTRRMTAVGKGKEPTTTVPAGTGHLPAIPTEADMAFIFTQVKADRTAVSLKPGESAQVTITNTAQGPMSLSLQGAAAGVDVRLDRPNLSAGEKAVLNLEAREGAQSGRLAIHVEQTGQEIPIQVTIQ